MAKEPKTNDPKTLDGEAKPATRIVRVPVTIVTRDEDGQTIEHSPGTPVELPEKDADVLVAKFGSVEVPSSIEPIGAGE